LFLDAPYLVDADRPVFTAPAPRLMLPPPALRIVADARQALTRTLSLVVEPGGPATLLEIRLAAGTVPVRLSIGGGVLRPGPADCNAICRKRGLAVHFWAPPAAGVSVELEVGVEAPVHMVVSRVQFDQSELGAILPGRRPKTMISNPFGFRLPDAAIVMRRFVL
jgi:hypothetical protein